MVPAGGSWEQVGWWRAGGGGAAVVADIGLNDECGLGGNGHGAPYPALCSGCSDVDLGVGVVVIGKVLESELRQLAYAQAAVHEDGYDGLLLVGEGVE